MGFGQTSLSGVRCGFMPPQLKTKQTFFGPKYFITVIFMVYPSIEKVAVMKYFSPKNALAKYLANAKFG
jgi:hypothetical protein